MIDDAFRFIRNDSKLYDVLVLDLTEEWFGERVELKELYRFIAKRCCGRCSCYIGPASPQTGGPERLRRHVRAAKSFLRS